MSQISFHDEIIVDCFAGGGGWSTGIEQDEGENNMKSIMKPILFNTIMVRRIREDQKTNTRRLACSNEEVYKSACFHGMWNETYSFENATDLLGKWYLSKVKKPPYKIGDILYVRETWCQSHDGYHYRADGEDICVSNLSGGKDYIGKSDGLRWRPSLHMPKKAARIFLRVTNIRVERLQDITIEDIEKEGVYCDSMYTRDHFAYAPGMYLHFIKLWDSTIKSDKISLYGYNANPWVWVISFERCDKPEEIMTHTIIA